MRNKSKKLTFYLVTLVMGVGMVTFPIDSGGMGGTRKDEEQANALPGLIFEGEFLEKLGKDVAAAAFLAAPESVTNPTPTFAATPTPLPTPSPVPTLAPEANVLLEKVPDDIVEFVENYFAVRLNGTAEEYRALFYDNAELDEQLANRRVEYIVAYHNLKCYAKLGAGEIDYVVYVQNDVEVATIDTYAPSIDQLFIKYDESGKPKLYLHGDSFTQEAEAYYEALRSAPDVMALIEDVNARLEEAITSDEALRDFFVRLSQETGGGE